MAFWQDEAQLYGITVKPYFFDAQHAMEMALAPRVLPFLEKVPPKTMFTEEDRQNFIHGQLIAQPDAVFEHGNGLICAEYKSVGGQSHSLEKWRREIRLKDMLQCLIAGYAVAQSYKRPTACVLRYHNVCYLLVPDPGVIGVMLDLIPLAKQYFSEPRRISASQIAQFSVERVRAAYPGPKDPRSDQGRFAHESMLKR